MNTVRSRWLKTYNNARGWVATWRQRYIWNPTPENKRQLVRSRERAAYAKRVLARNPQAAVLPLRERAYYEASKLVGVMEQGGNNRGPAVEKIIRSGGGVPGQAWCGWFNAHCYKIAGSKAVTWRWGAVRLLLPGAGLRRVGSPARGDIVRFTFDHEGMYVRDLGDRIETIEGNTGRSGAVSDSKTGGDGVYRKRRYKSMVRDYVRVSK